MILCQEMTRHTHVAQLFVTKGSGCIEYCNPKAQKLWPHPAKKNCQQTVEEIIDRHSWANDEEKQEVICRYRELTPESEPFEVVCVCTGSHDNADSFHRMIFTPCSHPMTGEDAVTISEYDVSDLKRVEAKLVEELRTQELTFNSISHELRAPLNGIVGLTDCALQSNDVPAHLRKSLKVIKATGQRMAGLVDDLLDAVSTRQSKLVIRHEMCDLYEISQEVIDIMTPLVRRNVTVHNRVPRTLPRIEGDSRRISQILTNLLSNASKFTSKGSISVDAVHVGDSIQLCVIDTGLGIPSDKLESIFGAFQQVDERTTRQYGGTGLGLTLVKSLVEAHHGSVTVSSVFACEGSGTTFTVELPLVQSQEHTHADLRQPLSEGSASSHSSVSERKLSSGVGSEHLAMLRAEEEAAELEQLKASADAQARGLRAQVEELTRELRGREEALRTCQHKLTCAETALSQSKNDPDPHRPALQVGRDGLVVCEAPPLSGSPSLSGTARATGRRASDEPLLRRVSSGRGGASLWNLKAGPEPTGSKAEAAAGQLRPDASFSSPSGAVWSGLGARPHVPSLAPMSRTSSSSCASSGPLQEVLMQHMLEREELLERRLLLALHAQQPERAEMHALRRSLLADSILSSVAIQASRVPS